MLFDNQFEHDNMHHEKDEPFSVLEIKQSTLFFLSKYCSWSSVAIVIAWPNFTQAYQLFSHKYLVDYLKSGGMSAIYKLPVLVRS